jgi:hypothetical protein
VMLMGYGFVSQFFPLVIASLYLPSSRQRRIGDRGAGDRSGRDGVLHHR